jgi:hypothetical protein
MLDEALPNFTEASKKQDRDARAPGDLPPRWKEITWRVFEGIQQDRVLLVSAGVTFYGLLALFPAIAALVSLYGLSVKSWRNCQVSCQTVRWRSLPIRSNASLPREAAASASPSS